MKSVRTLPFPTRKPMHVYDWNLEFRKFRRVWGMTKELNRG